MKTLIRSNNRSPLRCGFFTLAIALCWFALSPPLKAQCPSACPGGANTALGVNALGSVNPAVGINNTAVGANALTNDTNGFSNVAIGAFALTNNTTGNFNMAIGTEALKDNNANFNLAIGFRVAYLNTTGRHLTGIGAAAMRNNTTGEFNTAIGAAALFNNTTTASNLAVGDSALTAFNGTAFTDGANTALGSIALSALTTGEENVVVGRRALEFATDGSNNVIVGWRAGDGLTTGDGNTFIGDQAGRNEGPTVSDVICLGSPGDTDGGQTTSNRAYIGNVHGVTPGSGGVQTVIIDNDGQLGSMVSSRRFKKDIKPMDQTSEAIVKLKPVTFHYKNKDSKNTELDYGLIAEDVAEVNPDWVIYERSGKPLSVRYTEINVMLLNEFIKEHKKVEEQQASMADLKSTVA
ncbi:MAG: tail fiber domain-containing protein, partial [Candidatus Udaeobacter sp.]